MSNLLINVHENLPNPTSEGRTYLVKGKYSYYHYGCDDFQDMGWGCGYRTLQTVCSWIKNLNTRYEDVPSIQRVQEILVDLDDKPKIFLNSTDWIGSFEACIVIDQLYNISCKIIHVPSGKDIANIAKNLVEHFIESGAPIMMGGDCDASSKGIVGIHVNGNDIYLLVVDPHFEGDANIETLQKTAWVKWKHLSEFSETSFYNLCLPQKNYEYEIN